MDVFEVWSDIGDQVPHEVRAGCLSLDATCEEGLGELQGPVLMEKEGEGQGLLQVYIVQGAQGCGRRQRI